MPDYKKFMKIKALIEEYEKDFEEYGGEDKPKDKKKMVDIEDGGQDELSDMSPDIETPEASDASHNPEKKRAKIAMYGNRLKKMGY